MKKIRKKIKIFVWLLTLSLLTLILGGWSATGDASIKNNGSVVTVLNVQSEKSHNDFAADLRRIIKGHNDNSGDDDFVKIQSIQSVESGYVVTLKLRRIDKVKAQGDFDWKSLKKHTELAENRKLIENLARGNWSNTWSIYYEGKAGSVQLAKSGEGQVPISIYDMENNKQEPDKFIAQALKSRDSDKLFMFRMIDIGGITSFKITFPGKIKYYAGHDISVVNSSTIEAKPRAIKANLVVKYVMDEDGNTSEQILGNQTIDAMIGYVVYRQNTSPLTFIVVGLIIGGAITLVVVAVIYFIKRGRKEKMRFQLNIS